jgi:hypothetical protein
VFLTALEAEHRLSSGALGPQKGVNNESIETTIMKTLGVLESYWLAKDLSRAPSVIYE